jgi:hypothetical protein
MINGKFLILQALQQTFVECLDLILEDISELLIVCFFDVVGPFVDIRNQFPSGLEIFNNWLRFRLLCEIIQQLGYEPLADLICIKIVLVLEEIAVLIKEDVAVMTVLFDEVLPVVLVDAHSFVL